MTYPLRDQDLADAKRELARWMAAGLVTVETPRFKPETVRRRLYKRDGTRKDPAPAPASPAAPSSCRNPTESQPQGGAGNNRTNLEAATPKRQRDLTPEAAIARWLTVHELRTGGMQRKAIAAKLGISLDDVILNLKHKQPPHSRAKTRR